jgi:hypothetical protein
MLIDSRSVFIFCETESQQQSNIIMGKQHNKVQKRQRRKAYLKRRKVQAKEASKQG